MKGIGLVFAGGGGKGAYEVGVWKYLHEIGLDQYVKAVSGTSVGALNAALFVGSSYELAEELWMDISQNKILTPKRISAEEILKWLIANGIGMTFPWSIGLSKVAAGTIMGAEKVAQMILNRIIGDHMFSREGIIEMISDGLNFNLLRTSEVECYVTCVKCQGFEVKRFKLNEFSDEDITSLLLASSAIPFVFPNEEFYGDMYCDGGIPLVGDNVPIKPIYDTGVENIIVVHLNKETIIDKKEFPNAKIIEIVPKEDLGDALHGTLDFSPQGALYRLHLGYEDAKRIMQPMMDMMTMAVAGKRMLQMAKQRNIEFEKKKEDLLFKQNEIKQKIENDGFEVICAELAKE